MKLHHPALFAMTLALSLSPVFGAEEMPRERPTLGIQKKEGIRVIFQITSGETKDNVSRGLLALLETYKNYRQEGVPAEEIELHAVVHGDAAEHLLTNEAWDRLKGKTGGNPSSELVQSLHALGVHVELCDSRRRQNGWEKADLLPSVVFVSNAFHRIAELQLTGFAYVRM